MSKLTDTFLGVLTIVLVVLNSAGSIIGGVWLLFLGEWGLVILAIGTSLLFPWAYALVTMPVLIFLPALNYTQKRLGLKGKIKISMLSGFLSQVFHDLIAMFWIVFVLGTAFIYAHENGDFTLPYVLVAYGVAIGPFQYMAKGEQDNEFTMFSLFVWTMSFFVVTFLFWLSLNILTVPVLLIIMFVHSIYTARMAKRAMILETIMNHSLPKQSEEVVPEIKDVEHKVLNDEVVQSFCSDCGKGLTKEIKFCSNCGAQVTINNKDMSTEKKI